MPEWKSHIRPHLAALRLSPARENEIVDELAQHLDDRWRELIAGGAPEEEAMRLALAQLRDTTLVRNLAPLRQAQQPPPIPPGGSTGHWVSDLWRDVRYAATPVQETAGLHGHGRSDAGARPWFGDRALRLGRSAVPAAASGSRAWPRVQSRRKVERRASEDGVQLSGVPGLPTIRSRLRRPRGVRPGRSSRTGCGSWS